MNHDIAAQIANLLNSQNQLMIHYDAAKILAQAEGYIIRFGDNEKVLGCVEVKRVQWYQCEIDHLSVHPDAKRNGLGKGLLAEAEAKAKQLGARMAQCTIRVGNVASEQLFMQGGYKATLIFTNQGNENQVTVYQKVLS